MVYTLVCKIVFVVIIIDLSFVFFLDLEPEVGNKSRKVSLFWNQLFVGFLIIFNLLACLQLQPTSL